MVFFNFGSVFSAQAKAGNKVLHFFHGSGWGGINRLSTIWSAGAQLGLREKQLFATSLHLRPIFKYYFVTQPL
jgi:hypothetical protein